MTSTAEATAGVLDVDVLALTAWAEARGDVPEGHSSVEERIAVMSVCRTRVLHPGWWGKDFRTVCLTHAQFSCWLNQSNPNHNALIALALKVQANQPTQDPLFDETRWLAQGIIRGIVLDRVSEADSYYAPAAHVAAPPWVPKRPDGTLQPPDVIVGRQHFYKLGPS